MTGAVGLATQEFAARFFANGARPDIILKSDQAINEDDGRPHSRRMGAAIWRP
jgi:hypothetical protein